MKTKKFFMTSLLVMGMIIAKAANGFAPELVLVSQPVLTYNANSVTVYYDLQNIGDYTYKGDIYIYLDPDNGYYYAKEYVRICAGRIRRVAVTIPAYRPNPSWTYTVMPYYELGDDLYSFTTFEYFEPVRFCWHGYHNEPWVVIHVHPRPRYYHRPGDYRYYYDGYRPMLPPPPPGGPAYAGPHHGMPPMNPMHHTYGYHHHNGGYPANYHPNVPTPGYNPFSPDDPHTNNSGNNNGGNNGNNQATVVPHGSNTPGSMSSNNTSNNNNNASTSTNNTSGATTRPNNNTNTSNNGATTRPNNNTNTNNSGATTRPNTGNNSSSGNVSRPNNNGNNSGTNNSGRVNNGSSRGNNSGTSSRGNSSNSSSRGNNSNSSSRGGNNTPSRNR